MQVISDRVGSLMILALLLTPVGTWAQTSSWEVEVHGGGLISSNPSAGTTDLPAGTTVLQTGPPGAPSVPFRTVPSWYFGDGAALVNQAVAGRLGGNIVPLDSVLKGRFVERQLGSAIGFRVSRLFGSGFAAEFAYDHAFGRLSITRENLAHIIESQASFVTTWNVVLDSAAGGTQVVGTDLTNVKKAGEQRLATGALLISLLKSGTVRPYVVAGAGIIAPVGEAPSATITGHYRFTLRPPPTPIPGIPQLVIDQTDSISVGVAAEKKATLLVGGGVNYALTDRWGVRADIRDHLHRDPVRTIVAVTPATAATGTSGVLTIFLSQSAPPLQFATSPMSLSTLRGAVADFTTFSGTGLVNQVNVSAGLYWRF